MVGLLMLGAGAASRAAVRAELDRTTVQQGQMLTLGITDDGAQSRVQPDVKPLRKDFEVVDTSSSTQTSIVNGTRSDRTVWLVRLLALHAGNIEIPAIAVGDEHTAPLALNVTAESPQSGGAPSGHVFIETEAATGKSIYVQQQIPYTVRLYYDDSVRSGNLAAPDATDAIVEQLGEEKHYREKRNGREYNVIERDYAIAPEKSGALRIPPVSFSGRAVLAQPRTGDDENQGDDLMARMLGNTPFANDPFFRNNLLGRRMFTNPMQPVVARGKEIALNVQPRPRTATGQWLPAEQIALHDSWTDNPPQFKVGEPVTRTITIDARGLAASQIPVLSLVQPGRANLYPETPDNSSRTDGKTVYGISKQSVTYIPTEQGKLDVPPVVLAWWNTRSDTPGQATLPAWEFKVAAGATGGQGVATLSRPAPAAALPPNAAESPWNLWTEQLRNRRVWLGGGAAVVMVILMGIALWRWRHPHPWSKAGDVVARADPLPRRSSAMRTLRKACAAGDRRAAKAALLNLARLEWPDDPPRGLGALAARLETRSEEIMALARSLYGSDGQDWKGDGLWAATGRGLRPKRNQPRREDDGLNALYS